MPLRSEDISEWRVDFEASVHANDCAIAFTNRFFSPLALSEPTLTRIQAEVEKTRSIFLSTPEQHTSRIYDAMVTRIGRIIDASESDVKARKPFEMVQPQVILSTDAEEIEEEGFEDEYGVRFEDLTQQVATELMRTMKSTRRAMRSSNGGKWNTIKTYDTARFIHANRRVREGDPMAAEIALRILRGGQ